MKCKIESEDLCVILSCISESSGSFTRIPSIINFLSSNTFPEEVQSFVIAILNDCTRSLAEMYKENNITMENIKKIIEVIK